MAVSHHSDPQRTARVRFGPSLAAATLDGHFEHPAGGHSEERKLPAVLIL